MVLPIIIKSPVIERLPVIVCSPDVLITVLSTSNFTLSVGPIDDVIPSPPTNVSVSVANGTVFVPVSAAILRVVEIETLPAEVKRPCASTANVGICVAPP